jgi:hypothetical protein
MKVIKITSSAAANTTHIYVASGDVIEVTNQAASLAPTVEALVGMFESDHAEAMSHIIGFPDKNLVEEEASKYTDWETKFELPKASVLNLFGGK